MLNKFNVEHLIIVHQSKRNLRRVHIKATSGGIVMALIRENLTLMHLDKLFLSALSLKILVNRDST